MARAVGDLLAEFDAGLEDEVSIPPSWNVAPTDAVPIVLERIIEEPAAPRQVRQLHWRAGAWSRPGPRIPESVRA